VPHVVVERGMPGFTVGAADVKMGLKGSHTHDVLIDSRPSIAEVFGELS
jgi:alkylation response protein AidB-like acyl-CoA dehydrogenase